MLTNIHKNMPAIAFIISLIITIIISFSNYYYALVISCLVTSFLLVVMIIKAFPDPKPYDENDDGGDDE